MPVQSVLNLGSLIHHFSLGYNASVIVGSDKSRYLQVFEFYPLPSCSCIGLCMSSCMQIGLYTSFNKSRMHLISRNYLSLLCLC